MLAVTLALMLSGLSGQRFCFLGYLPKEAKSREQTIRTLEQRAWQEGATQLFIEAPHRNRETLEHLLHLLKPQTMLCLCWNLTLPTQGVMTLTVEQWNKQPLPSIDKKPTMFLVGTKY